MCACLTYIILFNHCMFFEVEGMFTFWIIKQRLQFESFYMWHTMCVVYIYTQNSTTRRSNFFYLFISHLFSLLLTHKTHRLHAFMIMGSYYLPLIFIHFYLACHVMDIYSSKIKKIFSILSCKVIVYFFIMENLFCTHKMLLKKIPFRVRILN